MISALTRYLRETERAALVRSAIGLGVLLALAVWSAWEIWSSITTGRPSSKDAGQFGVLFLVGLGGAALLIWGQLFVLPRLRDRAAAGDQEAARRLAAGERAQERVFQNQRARLSTQMRMLSQFGIVAIPSSFLLASGDSRLVMIGTLLVGAGFALCFLVFPIFRILRPRPEAPGARGRP